MAQINKKPKLIKNSIAEQLKTSASGLSLQEWNLIVNILKQQTNRNTDHAQEMHEFMFGKSDVNTTGVVELEDDGLGFVAKFVETLEYIEEVIVSNKEYVDSEIISHTSIIKIEHGEPLDELNLILLMQTLEDEIYRVKTIKNGNEILHVSEMFVPVEGQEELQDPELVLTKEYSRRLANGTSFRWNTTIQDWELAAGGGGGSVGGTVDWQDVENKPELQDKLVAGYNITIDPNTNVISSGGGGGITNFVGTMEEYDIANSAGQIPSGILVIITDEEEEIPNSSVLTAVLGTATLGSMILGHA